MHDFELYGASLFETLRSKFGNFWRLHHHWQRFQQSAQTLGFQAPSYDAFAQALVAHANPNEDLILRFTLLQTGGGWSSVPKGQSSRVLKRRYRESPSQEVRLFIPEQRLGCDDLFRTHKTGARFLYQHLQAEAKARGFDDCLLIDRQQRVLETCFSNVLWQNAAGRWFTTPKKRGILPGIFRDWLIEKGMVGEADIHLETLLQCPSVLICNSVRGLRFVDCINQVAINSEGSQAFAARLPQRNYEPYLP